MYVVCSYLLRTLRQKASALCGQDLYSSHIDKSFSILFPVFLMRLIKAGFGLSDLKKLPRYKKKQRNGPYTYTMRLT